MTYMRPKFDYKYHSVSVDDEEFLYWDVGEGQQTLFLIHGLAESVENWAWTIPYLERQYRVVALNLPGFGRSPIPKSDYLSRGLPGTVDQIDTFLSKIDVVDPIIIGHSLGTGIALEYALTFPNKLRKLILISAMGFGKEIDLISRLLTIPAMGLLFFHPSRFLVRKFFPSTVPIQDIEILVDLTCKYLKRPDYKNWNLEVLRSGIDLQGQTISFVDRDFSSLHGRVLLVWGEKDPLFPVSHAEKANQLIPSSELIVLEDVYHHPNIERAEYVSQILMDFASNN